MGKQAAEELIDDLETEEELELEEPEAEEEEPGDEEQETEDKDDDDPEAGDEPEPGEEEVVVTIGDAPAPDPEDKEAPEWVKELRRTNREQAKRIKELEQQATQAPPAQKIELGPKPKLEDFDYDTDAFATGLEQWHEKKRKLDAQETEQRQQTQAQQDAWQAQLNVHAEAKAKLKVKVKDFDEAEAEVLDAFDEVQQGIVVQGAQDSALVFYALGKNPDKLKELSSIKDPVRFTFAVAKLEKDLKMTTRKVPATPPEKTLSGTGPKSGTVDSTLERLRTKAAKTGDYTEVTAYKRKLRARGKK